MSKRESNDFSDATIGRPLPSSKSDSGEVSLSTRSYDANSTPTLRKIGPYTLLQKIGEGGMGTVWMAEQEKPVRRRVALKLITAGLADKRTIGRFEAERQALAMMDHPHIARVLDAGTSDKGEPYFAMELVQGDPLTRYCDFQKLSLTKRLELFVQVCDAVQHAHHKGIVHRDLKPSNVLVCAKDAQHHAKVIDFGLAKALQHQIKLTEKTVFTELGQVLGTVQYMSPEQARLDAVDIDTRTDVYSLGVLLYELLAGTTPIEKSVLKEQAILSVLEMIRNEDPPRPSQRLGSSVDGELIGKRRQIQVNKLQQVLRGELDWIVMRALEKDRTRRYSTPNDFAEDVRRFVAGEAVEARPPSAGYRLRKTIGRHRLWVATGTVILLLLTGGVVGMATLAKNEHLARRRSDQITEIVSHAFLSADPDHGARADIRAKEVLIRTHELLKTADLDEFGKRRLYSHLSICFTGLTAYDLALETALSWKTLAEETLGNNHVETLMARQKLAEAYAGVGRALEAIELGKETLAVAIETLGPEHPTTRSVKGNLANTYIDVGCYAEGLPMLEQLLQRDEEKFGANHPQTLLSMHNLGATYFECGRLDEAKVFLEQALGRRNKILGIDHPLTLTTRLSLANCHRQMGRTADAITLDERTLDLASSRLGERHGTTFGAMGNLSLSYLNGNRLSEAIELQTRCLKLSEEHYGGDHPLTLSAAHNLALIYREAGRLAESIEIDERTLRKRRILLGNEHPDTLRSINNVASGLFKQGQVREAAELFEQLSELKASILGADHPDTLRTASNLAMAYGKLGRFADSIALSKRTVEYCKAKLGIDHPLTLRALRVLAGGLFDDGRFEEAIESSRLVIESEATQPGMGHQDLSFLWRNAARKCAVAGNADDAAALAMNIHAMLEEQLGASHPQTLRTLFRVGYYKHVGGRFEGAVEVYRQVLKQQQDILGPSHPDTLLTTNQLGWILATNQALENQLNDQFVQELRQACAISKEGHLFNTLATVEYRLGNFKEAIAAAECSVEKMSKPPNPINFAILAMSQARLGDTEKAEDYRAKLAEAMKAVEFKDNSDCKLFADEVADFFATGSEAGRTDN